MTNDGNAMREAREFLRLTRRDALVLALDTIGGLAETAEFAAESGDWEAAEVLRSIEDAADSWNWGIVPGPPHPALVAAWN